MDLHVTEFEGRIIKNRKWGGQQHNRKHIRMSPYFIGDIMQPFTLN